MDDRAAGYIMESYRPEIAEETFWVVKGFYLGIYLTDLTSEMSI